MKHSIICFLFAVVMLASGCRTNDLPSEGLDSETREKNGGIIILTSNRTDGIINLSMDALERDRGNIWIDLDNNRIRAKDGSEDVNAFDGYRNYTVAPGVNRISIYGNITYLGAACNKLTEIDISGNTRLNTLNIPFNELSVVDVSRNEALLRLDVSENKLNILELSSNSGLISLSCFNNRIGEIDLSHNIRLSFLDCSGNELSSLDISANTQLTKVIAYNNRLTMLDISNNPLLRSLWVFGNLLNDTETARIRTSFKGTDSAELWLNETNSPTHE